MSKKKLSTEEQTTLINTLQTRFDKNKKRHSSIKWEDVATKLEAQPDKLWVLHEMETTGGEPDVIAFDKKTGEYTFVDCAPESPKGRRSVCYDGDALAARKQHKPDDSAIEMAKAIGIEILDEEEYRHLQTLGEFDLKTSSWIKTPPAIRKLGGALFGDRRYDHVFFYHNGADSYYGTRGFRGKLKV